MKYFPNAKESVAAVCSVEAACDVEMKKQIFFDREGKEIHRRQGFLSEEEIVRQRKDMGVK